MTLTHDLVAGAADLIDYDSYVLQPDGSMLAQSSAQPSILRMLRLLEAEPGMRVLEIGTGSGYTGALLGRIVDEQGSVTSLDIDPGLVTRAEAKHAEHGVHNVTVRATDGFTGWNASVTYDRIVGWVTPHLLPRRWVEQTRDQATIVTPIKVAPIAGANMILRVDVDDGRPTARDVQPGGYIEMHCDVITDFPVPVRYVDGLLRVDDHAVWVSAPALRQDPDLAGRAVQMIAAGRPAVSPLATGSTAIDAFHCYLLGCRLEGLASTGVGSDWGIGLILGDSAAFLRPDDIYVAGTRHAEDQLRVLLTEWEQTGRPDHTALETYLTEEPDGFGVHVVLTDRTWSPHPTLG